MSLDANRTNREGIPNASEGQEMSSSDINNLGNSISKYGVAPSLNGINVATFGDGYTIGTVHRVSEQELHPWRAFTDGHSIKIVLGCVFVDIPCAGGFSINDNLKELSGGKNAWFGKGISRTVNGYPDPDKKSSYFPMGAELWVDIPNANVINSRQLYSPTNPFINLKAADEEGSFEAGVYYIQLTAWSGRQITTEPYPNTTNEQLIKINAEVAEWNKYSLAMKGRTVPVLKYAPQDVGENNPEGYIEAYSLSKVGMYYPLFRLDYKGIIFQAIKSDIYMLGYTLKPFEVSVIGDQAYVTAGTVNGVVPQISSDYLDSIPKPSITVDGEGLILLKAEKETGKFFPKKVSVIFQSGDLVPPDDTVNEGYLQIAKITKPDNTLIVSQTSTGNKLLNRTQMGTDSAWWAWSS